MNEKTVYRKLSEIPPVPDSVYPRIEKIINRGILFRQTLRVVAALLIVALGIGMYLNLPVSTQQPVATGKLTQDVVEELQTVQDFLNGNTVEEEFGVYTLADNGIY